MYKNSWNEIDCYRRSIMVYRWQIKWSASGSPNTMFWPAFQALLIHLNHQLIHGRGFINVKNTQSIHKAPKMTFAEYEIKQKKFSLYNNYIYIY